MTRLGQFALMVLAVVLGLVVTIYAYSVLSDPISHDDVIEELAELEQLVAENSCLLLLTPSELRNPAEISECRTVDPDGP